MIELLVVIAIIAILSAILFPVFAQARQKARATSYLSNLNQITKGALMYAQDYDDTRPGNTNNSFPPAPNNTQVFWWQVLPSYIQSGVVDSTNAYNSTTNSSAAGGVFAYSSAKDSENLLGGAPRALNYVPVATIVEYNQVPNGQTGAGSAQGGSPLAAVKKPGSTAWITDNGADNVNGTKNNPNLGFFTRLLGGDRTIYKGVIDVGGSVSATDPTASNNAASAVFNVNEKPLNISGGGWRISFRHSGGSNYGYMDRHCKWSKGETVFNSVQAAQKAETPGNPSFTSMFDVEQP